MSGESRSAETGSPAYGDGRPTLTSAVISMAAGVLALLTSALFVGVGLVLGVLGLASMALGLFLSGSRGMISFGVTSLFVCVLLAGSLSGATPLMLLTSTLALLVAWDTGHHAVTVGEQFGRATATRRGELVHAAGGIIVGAVGAGFAYGIYVFGVGDRPAIAVILLVLGVVGLVWGLRD